MTNQKHSTIDNINNTMMFIQNTMIIKNSIEYIKNMYGYFRKLNKITQVTFITVTIHWILLQIFSYYCTPIIRSDTTMHWLIDSGYSILIHPTIMAHPICAGCTYYMNKMSELFVSTWYIAAMGILSQLWVFAGGGFEKIKTGL